MFIRKLAFAAALLVLACGKRGDPRPPIPVIPQATSDLLVTQRAEQVILSWSFPALTTAGRSLPAIRRISVYRYEEGLPVSALDRSPDPVVAGEIEPDVPRPVALFSRIATIPKVQFEKLATRVDSIEKANLGTATAGARLIFTDAPPFQTSDGRPLRLTYAVVTEGETARGDFSNLATIVPLSVAVPPAALTATPKAEGVLLAWSRPDKAVGSGGAPVILGYHIYRTAPGQPLDDLAAPINNAPVKEAAYTDVPSYGEYQYRVTAVATAGPPLIQSAPSAPASAAFRDLVAPPPPASVTALLETNLVRLVWEPVAAPDLKGYLIYRIEQPYRLKVTPGPVTTANFVDISIEVGIAYHYEITSVDNNGNESAPTKSETIIVPKTP